MKHSTWTPLLFVALTAIGVASLTACGGGSVVRPPKPVDPPKPAYSAGPYAINGIDRIPQSMVKLTREEMQRKFVLGEVTESHARRVGKVACESYIQSGDCDNQAARFINTDGTIRTETGSTPFTKVVSLGFSDDDSVIVAREIAKMPEVKIVNWSTGGGNIAARHISSHYLAIQGVGNGSGNISWYDDLVTPADKVKIAAAITEHRLVYVAGWDRVNGNYVRHEYSSSCRGNDIREGCVWTQFEFPGLGGGTSYSTPQFAAALASVLAISPDTTPQNLARFGKACVIKTGNGIEELLRISGGLGVADFACVGNVVSALANLPTGGTTNLSINGQPVVLSGRRIAFSFADGISVPMEKEGFFFDSARNGEKGVLLAVGHRRDDLFTALSYGTRDDFFGFRREHKNIREAGITAGYGNFSLLLSEQRSSGGGVIRRAVGRSLTLTAKETFPLTESTALTVTASADRFLGGRAVIPLSTVDLSRGDWNHRLFLVSDTALTSALSFRTEAGMSGGREYTFGAGIRLTF